mmetsp:Transcript_54529/g.151276  ORF Transcript_54529/g.151276 Transcript_54529/m.151276 type:complete len:205 (+) Transcript_54529:1560-2174(+)
MFGWSMSSIMLTSLLNSVMLRIFSLRMSLTARGAMFFLARDFASRTMPKLPLPRVFPRLYRSSIRVVSVGQRWSQTMRGKCVPPKEPGTKVAGTTPCGRDGSSSSSSSFGMAEDSSSSGMSASSPFQLGSKRTCTLSGVRPRLPSTTVIRPCAAKSGRTFWISPTRGATPSKRNGVPLLSQTAYLYSKGVSNPTQLRSSVVQMG